VVEASDVLLEVLDARDPLGSHSAHFEKYIGSLSTTKHIVLVLNKADLVPREAVRDWVATLSANYPTLAFKCAGTLDVPNATSQTTAVAGAASARADASCNGLRAG